MQVSAHINGHVFVPPCRAKRAEFCCVQFGCFWTNGQICSATSRLLVHESIADKFYARLKQRAESIKISDPLEPNCRLGPVVAESQLAKIMDFIQVCHTPTLWSCAKCFLSMLGIRTCCTQPMQMEDFQPSQLVVDIFMISGGLLIIAVFMRASRVHTLKAQPC